jgi:predicted small lipoprotein YifL
VSRFAVRPLVSLALIGAFAAALTLAGCGRKGPLDPPPGASIDGVAQPNMPDLMSKTGKEPEDGKSKAPKGPDKRIPLDAILN